LKNIPSGSTAEMDFFGLDGNECEKRNNVQANGSYHMYAEYSRVLQAFVRKNFVLPNENSCHEYFCSNKLHPCTNSVLAIYFPTSLLNK
jgi:hypothetical protein